MIGEYGFRYSLLFYLINCNPSTAISSERIEIIVLTDFYCCLYRSPDIIGTIPFCKITADIEATASKNNHKHTESTKFISA